MNILNTIERIAFLILGLLKSIWNATIHIVWGIATTFLLAGLIGYFTVDASSITTLLKLTVFLINNWVLFWWVFFALELFPELNKMYSKKD